MVGSLQDKLVKPPFRQRASPFENDFLEPVCQFGFFKIILRKWKRYPVDKFAPPDTRRQPRKECSGISIVTDLNNVVPITENEPEK